MAVAIDRKAAGLNPATGRPRTVIGSLRNVAACALGGAVIAGALFGHDVRGYDPGAFGAALGTLAGLTGWAAGRL